jgi:hypothetical protein
VNGTLAAPVEHSAAAGADPDLQMVNLTHFPTRLPLYADMLGIRDRRTDAARAGMRIVSGRAAIASLPSREMARRIVRIRSGAAA